MSRAINSSQVGRSRLGLDQRRHARRGCLIAQCGRLGLDRGELAAVLRLCGLGFADVVKCTIILADMTERGEFNKVYVTYFPLDRLPARSAFGCSGLALGGRLEVECLARIPSSGGAAA